MNKRLVLIGVTVAMACMALVGCGVKGNETHTLRMAPGVSVEVTGNHGGFTMEGDSSLGEMSFEDVMEMITPNSVTVR